MLIRVPDYYDRFRCLAGACPHTCCEAWEVVIDGETAARYRKIPGPLGEKLRQAMAVDEEGDVCFPALRRTVPFSGWRKSCEIHRELGEEATSVTCQEHPRFTEDYGSFREISLSASCPAANALVLGSSQTLTFCTRETAEDGEESDPWTEALLPVRERMLTLLADRSKCLRKRLADVLLLAAAAQELLDQEKIGKLPAPGIVLAAEAMGGGERGDIPDGAARFKRTGYFGSCLADAAGPGGENRSDSGVGGPSGAYGSVFHLSLSAQSSQ